MTCELIMRVSRLIAFAALSVLAVPNRTGAQALGTNFQVNTFEPLFQGNVALAGRSSGEFVAVWQSAAQEEGDGIYGQMYGSDGAPVGGEFHVNVTTADEQRNPDVAWAASGEIMVVWRTYPPSLGIGPRARVFDSAGVPITGEFDVFAPPTAVDGAQVAIAPAAGGFVVVAEGGAANIVGRRITIAGVPVGAEFLVSTSTPPPPPPYNFRPDIAADAAGNFVVVWEQNPPLGGDGEILGQRYDASANPIGGNFQVNSDTSGIQELARVARRADGEGVVVWHRSTGEIAARALDGVGSPVGSDFSLDTPPKPFVAPYEPVRPDVAADPSGGYLAVWHYEDSVSGTYGRRLDANATPIRRIFQVNTNPGQLAEFAAVAGTGSGGFVVAFMGLDSSSTVGVVAQRYNEPCDPTPRVGCKAAASSAGAFKLKRDALDPRKDSLLWKWVGGAATDPSEFGDPTNNTQYTLCVYDGGGVLQMTPTAPAGLCKGTPCWRAKGSGTTAGFRYSARSFAGLPGGAKAATLTAGAIGATRIKLKGKGLNITVPTLPPDQTTPITVQLVNGTTSACWEATYSAPAVTADVARFSDRND